MKIATSRRVNDFRIAGQYCKERAGRIIYEKQGEFARLCVSGGHLLTQRACAQRRWGVLEMASWPINSSCRRVQSAAMPRAAPLQNSSDSYWERPPGGLGTSPRRS